MSYQYHIANPIVEIRHWYYGRLTSIGNPIVEIRRSYDHLISTMGFPIMVKMISLYWIGAPGPVSISEKTFFVRSRKVSKPRDWYFKLSHRFEIWQAHRQHRCRSACQISERWDNSKYKYRRFETLRDLTERHLFGYWDGSSIPESLRQWQHTFQNFISHNVPFKFNTIPISAKNVLNISIDDYFSTHRRCHNNFAMRPFRQNVISPLCTRGRNGGWARLVALVKNRDMPMLLACFPLARADSEHAHSIGTFNQGTTGYATAYPNLDRQIKRALPPGPAGGEMTNHMTAMWWYPRDSVTQSVLHCDFKIFNKNEKSIATKRSYISRYGQIAG